MAVHNYRGVGLRNVGSYQISGEPYISGTIDQADERMKRFEFPTVVKEVTIHNLSKLADNATASNQIEVHFASGSIGASFASTDLFTITGQNWHGNEVSNVGVHSVTLRAGESLTFAAKCKEVYVTTVSGSANYRVLAEVTAIPTSSMYHLSGSGLTSIDGN